ncbi:hypothetical protein N7499_003107 [Penicillium canescens]|uniref:Zn(2)-C6 fungal-type domain-containing protein n=1 Tax=Penicillium canescens TaxID=5083 RepID=A0AAD6ICC4_PENCN|nr:uncharacterized protein N7446_011980 [Penicillium canescens]KAJ6019795.1 hypothetical protein N7522_000503 [Penicillium canescens]KAJ6039086.1 hypothetical protein N7460_007118 [Penicillium canescens]KAJ6047146.1 hypothetical protein N7446_011980 [Penicillium canescens]KAJ6059893.1 hypothetical protein N7444_003532 [Penicillium canescens]KAJ6093776.1 hypothetical protein N7499_003107 [Penicillium canescens]
MNHVPHHKELDALPIPHAFDELSRHPPHPPSFESHPPAPQSFSANSQAPLPTQKYLIIRNHELQGLTPEDPYGRPNGLLAHAPVHFPQYPNLPQPKFRQPMTDAPRDGSPDDHSHMVHPLPDQINSAGYTSLWSLMPPALQFMTPFHQMAAATPPGGYDSAFYQNQMYGSHQPKTVKAQQACGKCRAKKAKCDERRPNCSRCKKNGLTCVYEELSPQKQNRSTQRVLDRLLHVQERLAIPMSKLHATQQSHKLMLQDLLDGNKPARPIQPGEEHSFVPEPAVDHDGPLRTDVSQTQATVTRILDSGSQDADTSKHGQQLRHAAAMYDDSTNEPEGELSIPVDHATAAHKLLSWPVIKKLLFPKEYDDDYVMRLEEERGLISIYDQGEIAYTADGSQLPRYGGFDGVRLDGGGAGLDSDVDVDKFGNLKLDAATAQRYYESYLANMFNLHPFLEQGELNLKVDMFIRCYCRPNTSPATNNMQSARDGPPPAKRKCFKENVGESVETVYKPLRPRVGKNIDNAMIMLCLALGAICEVPAPLPGPIMNQRIDYRSQPIPGPLPPLSRNGVYDANDILSPPNPDSAIQMPRSHSTDVLPTQATSQLSSSILDESRGNLSRQCVSIRHNEQRHTRNHQIIPGLALYGYAAAILGHLQGGNELEHVQTGLLAGLYAGQLAHPFQSHSWISQASRACQMLVRSKRYERLEEGPVQDLYNFAYWTCLQLESDLLTELDLPASGISRYESRMILPKGKFMINHLPDDRSAPTSAMMLFYSAQIHLRKILNRVHKFIHKAENQGQTRWSLTVQETLSMNLGLWRTSLPDIMKWEDSDEPANEINAACMRAKYYGAQFIIHRPLLHYALHYGRTGAGVGLGDHASMESSTSSREVFPSTMHQSNNRASNMTPISSDRGSTLAAPLAHDLSSPKVQLRELPKKLRIACKICVDSAILSTKAFDGVGGHRLVVTNIFGTAHAQFGNMLVLSATYMSSLRELVDAELLERLLRRTIGFLVQCENISPTLRADARILSEVYQNIFHHAPDMSQQY